MLSLLRKFAVDGKLCGKIYGVLSSSECVS